MPDSYSTKISPIINFSAKMNARENNETLDIDPNSTGMQLVNLSNGDLFYTKALTVREGVQDVCGGIINASGTPTEIYNLYSGTGSINGTYPRPVYMTPISTDREGNIINFGSQTASGISTFGLFGGTIILQDTSASGTIVEAGYDVEIQMYLAPISGTGLTNPSQFTDAQHNQTHSTALSGNFSPNYNAPSLINIATQLIDPTPLAISLPTIVNFGPASQYTNISGTYQTPWLNVPWQLSAPYNLSPNTPYYLYIVANNTSGVSNRGLNAQTIYGNNDIQLNVMYSNLFLSLVSGNSYPNVLRQYEGVIPVSGTKSWLAGEIDQYNYASYKLADYPFVSSTFSAPISGTANNPILGFQDVQNYQNAPNSNPFPGTKQSPTVSTTNAEFGSTYTLGNGSYNVNGAYIYANIFTNTNWNLFTTNKSSVNAQGYIINYVCNMYQVLGTNSNGSLEVNQLTAYSGNYTFNSPNSYQNPYFNQNIPGAGINTGLEKIYAVFPNPVNLNNNAGTYLFTWQFLNPNTDLPLTDYAVTTQTNAGNYYDFASPIIIGASSVSPGTFYRKENIGFIGYSGNVIGLAGGLISFQSGTAITSIYDYRVGDNRSQRVMFTQGPNLSFFELNDPTEQTIIFTSGVTSDNAKWSHSTYQDLLFSHQYSQISGICWDQIYSNPSGNWTQLHGLQPVFSGTSATLTNFPAGYYVISGNYTSGTALQGSGIPYSSNFDIILTTQILSGGLRASDIFSISGANWTASGNNAYQILGIPSNTNEATYPYDIYHVSGAANASGHSQYNFDVFSNGTYVWATQPSGSVYYLAPLCDSSGNAYPNPMPNVNTFNMVKPYYSGAVASGSNPGPGVFIYDIGFSGINAQQVPNIINYDQTYITNQVTTPSFKKTLVYYNLLLGIGDPNNPSRIWFSEQIGPQIWGVDTNFYGFYDVDVDNGQEITGMEIYKNYLIIFKENSTYSASYTSLAGNPLNIQQISPVKGNLGIFNTVATDYGVFGLSQYGPILSSFYSVETIGDEILPYYETLDHTDLIYSVAVHDVARQQIYWSISNSNESPNNQTGIVYSYAERAWGIRQNGMWNAAGQIGDVDNFALLFGGDTYGQIKQINSGIYGDDVVLVDTTGAESKQGVDLSFETPWLSFNNSQDLKQMKALKINCATSDQTLRIDIYTNQNETAPRYTRYLNMSNPVYNRSISLAGTCNTFKIVVNTVGTPDMVKINSMELTFIDLGPSSNI